MQKLNRAAFITLSVCFLVVISSAIFYFFQQHAPGPQGMVWIPGGDFMMGNEKQEYKVHVEGFWMDQTDVTNDQFAAFVKATGYVTTAEQTPADKALVSGANWHHPQGPQSNIIGKGEDPVVQVSYQDVFAYAKWAGKRLPTEVEWEFAAHSGFAPGKMSMSPQGLYDMVGKVQPVGFRLVETQQMFDTARQRSEGSPLSP